MNDDPHSHFVGGFVYFADVPAEHPELVRAAVRGVLNDLDLTEGAVKLAQYFLGGDQRAWLPFEWARVEEALTNPECGAIDVLHGTPRHVRMTMNVKLRSNPAFKQNLGAPRSVVFLGESAGDADGRLATAGRHLLQVAAASRAAPISGGVFRAETFYRALSENSGGHDIHLEPKWFQERNHHDQWHSTKLRTLGARLYPMTLLGPALAAQVSPDDLRAAGAAGIERIDGSLIIDAPGEVVETWDAGFLARTVELRRLLWPLTIKNPADAAGLD